MLFVSKNKVVFQIVIGGQYRLVEFSEIGVNGGYSLFRTTNAVVAEAIRKHRFFRQGRIWETEDTSAAEALRTLPGEEEKKEKEGEVMDFTSWSHLKSFLKKTYKDDVSVKKIKTPEEVGAYAKSKGVNYRFVEQ